MSKTILFFGNERLATGVSSQTPIFKSLINLGYHIPALIVSQDDLGKSRSSRELEIVKVAEAKGIKVLSYANLRDKAEDISQYGAEAAVLVAYGKIIPENILNLFSVGIINVHPSLLPRHRGPTPIESTLLDGDAETGVSVMKLGKDMDSGPIYAQQTLSVSGKDTKQGLSDRLDILGSEMLAKHLESILDGSLIATDQPAEGVTYDKLITKQDGLINWSLPALQIERQIRAFSIWPRSKANLGGIEVTILEAHVIEGSGRAGSVFTDGNQLGIYTTGDILIIDKLLPAGKKGMSGQSFLAGYGLRLRD